MPGEKRQEQARLWSVNQQKFMLFLATPSELRMPLTETAYAHENDLNPATLWKWKQIPGFKEEVHKLIMDSLGDVFHDVTYSFKKEATKGSYQHQRMYFEMMGAYVEKHEVKGSLIVEGGLSDDELIARADAVIAKRTPHTP